MRLILAFAIKTAETAFIVQRTEVNPASFGALALCAVIACFNNAVVLPFFLGLPLIAKTFIAVYLLSIKKYRRFPRRHCPLENV